jgi:hypothetical protein
MERWRQRGSLQFLAFSLGKTAKQVARYWDQGWIPGSYATARGHRRIRYEADSVDRVRRILRSRKQKNILIRYYWKQVDYFGMIIPLDGCNTVDHVFQRLCQAGLSEEEARYVAYSPEPEDETPSFDDAIWDITCAAERILEPELGRELQAIPGLFTAALTADDSVSQFERDHWISSNARCAHSRGFTALSQPRLNWSRNLGLTRSLLC